MANEQLFNDKAENYASGRLGYAPGVVDLVCNEILAPNGTVADVGSGTGIFAAELIKRGHDVYCVEPNVDMRLQAEKLLGGGQPALSIGCRFRRGDHAPGA